MLNVARNLGGTIGISMVQALLATRQQFHQARLIEHLEPLNPSYAAGVHAVTQTLTSQGFAPAQASQSALGVIYQSVVQQASMQAFIDCFWVLMLFVAFVIPTVFFLKRTPLASRP